ncbi:unnamed protein product [Diplocarpon coronariae]
MENGQRRCGGVVVVWSGMVGMVWSCLVFIVSRRFASGFMPPRPLTSRTRAEVGLVVSLTRGSGVRHPIRQPRLLGWNTPRPVGRAAAGTRPARCARLGKPPEPLALSRLHTPGKLRGNPTPEEGGGGGGGEKRTGQHVHRECQQPSFVERGDESRTGQVPTPAPLPPGSLQQQPQSASWSDLAPFPLAALDPPSRSSPERGERRRGGVDREEGTLTVTATGHPTCHLPYPPASPQGAAKPPNSSLPTCDSIAGTLKPQPTLQIRGRAQQSTAEHSRAARPKERTASLGRWAMSQLLQPEDPRALTDPNGNVLANAPSSSQLQFFPHDSPTAGRSRADSLPQTISPPRSEQAAKRSPRRPAPSPRQTSTAAALAPACTIPGRTTCSGSTTDDAYTSSPLTEEPDDVRAAEQSSSTTQASPAVPNEEARFGSSRPIHEADGPARSLSDTVLLSHPPRGSSRPGTRAPMASSPAPRVDMACGPPRTSSIDSAISSLSAGHSKKGSTDSQAPAPDIANLVQAAGSPDAVIQYLLKEKASQASQNSQLWRLVDKQRAMILGLNKDLERALKEKERYRKKLKESPAQVSNPSPVDSTRGPASESGSMSSETKPADAAAPVSAGLTEPEQPDRPPTPIDVALAPSPLTPPPVAARAPALASGMGAEHQVPSYAQPASQRASPDAPGPGGEAAQPRREADEEGTRGVPYHPPLPLSRPSDPPRGPPPSVPPPRAPVPSQGPALHLLRPSPDPDEGLRSFPAPPRKAPPAPLNLGVQGGPSKHLRQACQAGDETDSDYDDILEINELPTFNAERGRRKTREQDDREREVAAAQDAEMRGFPTMGGKNPPASRPTSPKDGSAADAPDSMPASPRMAVQISPPDSQVRYLSPHDLSAGSLAGILREVSGNPSPLVSPGLPGSPRPADRSSNPPTPRDRSHDSPNFHSPPLSARGMGAFPGAGPLSPRAPRQPIPLPPNTPMSIGSPGLPPGAPLLLVSPRPLVVSKGSDARSAPVRQRRDSNSIFRGLATEEYPDLLLPPNALPSIDVKVASSRLKPSRSSITFPRNAEEDPVFTLAVFARSDGRELWRVEKDSMSLANLDQTLKQSHTFTAKTPERSLFTGHAPAKVDARREALDRYLEEILDTPMDTASAVEICRYLSSNTMEPYADGLAPGGDAARESPTRTGPGGRPLRSGYLTKRGKNFGGWKARYFVLDGPVFKYYESPGGPHLGAIKLQNAQIGKQQQQQQQQAGNQSPSRGELEDADNQYRHAFLILEPKRKDSSSLVRHVLCAESDHERDQWVEALLLYVDRRDNDGDDAVASKQHDRGHSTGSAPAHGKAKKKTLAGQGRSMTLPDMSDDGLRGAGCENARQAHTPPGSRLKNPGTPSPPTLGYERDPAAQGPQSQPTKNISGPRNAQVIQDSSTWGGRQGLAPAGADDRVKQKKRSFFGFGSKPRASLDADHGAGDANTSLSQMAFDQHGPIRPVFGSPLGEAVRYNHPVDINVALPAVVYRCVEYLSAKNAAGEEGIFRLSGSNVVIKQLRERFNVEGDVNLVTDDQYYDIHAVASLLKLYLRELPTTILTRELHLEFLGVTELQDVQDKISALNGLVHRLPRANNALLRYLSGFLINIVNHADTNKMTVRNVGIVFSPTLNIPAPVFALFLQQYDEIFGEEPDDHDRAGEVAVAAPPLSPKDTRSPRRQRFQDLPTPSYNQQSFPKPQAQPASSQPQHYQPQSQRPTHDTGFAPLQPTHEPRSGFPTMAGPEYGRSSQPQTLAGPAYDQFGGYRQPYGSENADPQSSKSKRRESSMFGPGMVPRKPSSNKLRDDSRKQLYAAAYE